VGCGSAQSDGEAAHADGGRIQLSAKRLSIKILPVRLAPQPSHIGIVTLKNRTLSPMADLFIRHMREMVGSLEPAIPL
jgi:hypothetical protein